MSKVLELIKEVSEMRGHQKRIVVEKIEVDERRSKLKSFIKTEPFQELDVDERQRLINQDHAMDLYSAVLGERIAAF